MASRKVVKRTPAKKAPAKKASSRPWRREDGDGTPAEQSVSDFNTYKRGLHNRGFYDQLIDHGDGTGTVRRVPINAQGAAGRTVRSPESLRAQGEQRWAQLGNRMGINGWTTEENYVRPTITEMTTRGRGNVGKLASKQKTKGKSGPTKKR